MAKLCSMRLDPVARSDREIIDVTPTTPRYKSARTEWLAAGAGLFACAVPMVAMANSPPIEPWRIVLALLSTFPLNLVFLPGVLVLLSFVVRQTYALVTVPVTQRSSSAHRQQTRRWWWALLAGLGFDALALVVLLLIFAAQ